MVDTPELISWPHYVTLVRNDDTGQEQIIATESSGPEQARADALHHAFRAYGWRRCSARQPGELAVAE